MRAATFWSRTERFLGCRLWRGGLDAMGYGRCQAFGEGTAQRVAWRFEFGDAPKGRLLNQCGNRTCVEPSHWRDAGVPVERAPSKRQEMRIEIRRLWGEGHTKAEIERLVGCAHSTVWRTLKGAKE